MSTLPFRLHAFNTNAASNPVGLFDQLRRTVSSFNFGNAIVFGQTWLQGSPRAELNDQLLQDIGVTRADYEAMRF